LMTCEKGLQLIRQNGCYRLGQDLLSMGLYELIDTDKLLDSVCDASANGKLNDMFLDEFNDIIEHKENFRYICSNSQQILSPLLSEGTKAIDVKTSSPHPHCYDSSSLRDVLHNPWDGQMWLLLAKNLLVQVTRSQNSCKNVIKTAAVAAAKAKMLIKRISIDQQGTSGNHTTAIMLSEAYALTAWLELLYVRCDGADGKLDIQRALILDPESSIARLYLSIIAPAR
jgi:hypothetical protein